MIKKSLAAFMVAALVLTAPGAIVSDAKAGDQGAMRQLETITGVPFVLTETEKGSKAGRSSFSREAKAWVHEHTRNLDSLNDGQKVSLYHIVTLFLDLIIDIEGKDDFYDEYHAAKRMPKFLEEGVLFVVLDKGRKQVDLPELAHLKGKKVREVYPGYKDDRSGNRLVDDIRGEGSHRFIVIPQESVGESITGNYSVLFHEFAHFIHLTALTPRQVGEIESLYQRATTEGLCLDAYAATNEHEYFAQGVEALVSKTKGAESWKYYKHERRDLATKDPALHRFIISLISHKTPYLR
ncbi:hypothetical protein ACFL2T_05575 [Elusimicrobiota bacterium]